MAERPALRWAGTAISEHGTWGVSASSGVIMHLQEPALIGVWDVSGRHL